MISISMLRSFMNAETRFYLKLVVLFGFNSMAWHSRRIIARKIPQTVQIGNAKVLIRDEKEKA